MKIEALQRELTQLKEARIKAGQPVDYPRKFVPPAVAVIIAERVPNFFPFIVKYAQIVNTSGELLKVDCSKFESYIDDVELISEVKGGVSFWAKGYCGALNLIRSICRRECDKSPEEVARLLYYYIRWMREGRKPTLSDLAYDYRLTSQENAERYKEIEAEYESFKTDEKAFEIELQKCRELLEERRIKGGNNHDNTRGNQRTFNATTAENC